MEYLCPNLPSWFPCGLAAQSSSSVHCKSARTKQLGLLPSVGCPLLYSSFSKSVDGDQWGKRCITTPWCKYIKHWSTRTRPIYTASWLVMVYSRTILGVLALAVSGKVWHSRLGWCCARIASDGEGQVGMKNYPGTSENKRRLVLSNQNWTNGSKLMFQSKNKWRTSNHQAFHWLGPSPSTKHKQ